MGETQYDMVIWPTDMSRYRVGLTYWEPCGNHFLWLRCLDFIEGYGFVFEELLDLPIRNYVGPRYPPLSEEQRFGLWLG